MLIKSTNACKNRSFQATIFKYASQTKHCVNVLWFGNNS